MALVFSGGKGKSSVSTYENELEESVRYLASDRALRTIQADAYWPKWDSPWWHMLLLYELGEVKRVPEKIVGEFIGALNKISLKIFPIHPGDLTKGIDPYRGCPCHCQLGNVYQVLAEWGVDVDKELPWIRPWFLQYQMSDGGLNCDGEAYLVEDETPSSMVGTIAAFESVLLHTVRPWTTEEIKFLNSGAKFLMERKLMHGSQTKHNAAERKSAEKWLKPCFPRFYFYDSLRGLMALLHWAVKTDQAIDPEAIREVVEFFAKRYPHGDVLNERQSFEGIGTIIQNKNGVWIGGQAATHFPLLAKVSAVDAVSPILSRQWTEAKNLISSRGELKAFAF